jgi:hypothetical protein
MVLAVSMPSAFDRDLEKLSLFFNSAVTIYISGILRIYEPGLFSSPISVAAMFYACKEDSCPMQILHLLLFMFPEVVKGNFLTF